MSSWSQISLAEQLGNIGSELTRGAHWEGRDDVQRQRSLERALALLDATIADPRWQGRRQELVRLREVVADLTLNRGEYAVTLDSLNRFLLPFAIMARSKR